ncbi:hypothetical protein AX14_013459 [Amanita brunnescens Koide BX004]|nr:hypothetical protein AX14_013459 [Amanita brunnescens Koide BX004]
MVASPSAASHSESFTSTSSRKRQLPPLEISTNDLPNNSKVADSNVEFQRTIIVELDKISKMLNADSTPPAATEASRPVVTRYSSGFWASSHVTIGDSSDKRITLEAAEYDALGQQFTTLVIISTFTANLIIGFLTLAHNILSTRQAYPMIQYEVGMFFALAGMAVHAGVIIIAGRGAALALKYAKRLPVQAHLKEERRREKLQRIREANTEAVIGSANESDDEDIPASHVATNALEGQSHPAIPSSDPSTGSRIDNESNHEENNEILLDLKPQPHFSKETQIPATPISPVPSLGLPETAQALQLPDFHRFLKTCESLQLIGTATFFLGVMILIFIMFLYRVFPIMLLVGCVASSCLMSWIIGFWKVSATKQLLIVAAHSWRRWLGVDAEIQNAGSSTPKKGGKQKTDGAKKNPRRRWSGTSLPGVHWQDEVDIEKGQAKDEKSA